MQPRCTTEYFCENIHACTLPCCEQRSANPSVKETPNRVHDLTHTISASWKETGWPISPPVFHMLCQFTYNIKIIYCIHIRCISQSETENRSKSISPQSLKKLYKYFYVIIIFEKYCNICTGTAYMIQCLIFYTRDYLN